MLIEKRWYYTLVTDPTRADGIVRHTWESWERAKAEALARGGVAEEEMIEVLKDDVTEVQETTGKRAYRYFDGAETPVKTYKAGDDYLVERRVHEARIKA